MPAAKFTPIENHYIQLDIAFAVEHDVNPALIFAKMHRLTKEWQGKTDGDGNKWIRLTYDEWEKELPFLSRNTIIRTLASMEEKGLILSTVFTGRSKWYRCNPEFVEGASTQNGQMHLPKMGRSSTQNGQLPNSSPNSSPKDTTVGIGSSPMPEIENSEDQTKNKKKPNNGTNAPPVIKIKTRIKDVFLKKTNLKMPKKKSTEGFWWSNFAEIADIANQDSNKAEQLVIRVVEYMSINRLTISGPQSIVNLCRTAAAGQLNGDNNGHQHKNSPDPNQPDIERQDEYLASIRASPRL